MCYGCGNYRHQTWMGCHHLSLTKKGSGIRHILGQYTETLHLHSGIKSSTSKYNEHASNDTRGIQQTIKYMATWQTSLQGIQLLVNIGGSRWNHSLLNAIDNGHIMMSERLLTKNPTMTAFLMTSFQYVPLKGFWVILSCDIDRTHTFKKYRN